MNKRRRTSSVASRQEEEMADETSEQSPVLVASTGGRKRKKLDPVKFVIISLYFHKFIISFIFFSLNYVNNFTIRYVTSKKMMEQCYAIRL